MKKVFAWMLVLAMVFSMAGCGLFADDSRVVLSDTFSHQDPKGLEYEERVVLKGDGYAELLEETVNAAAYPNTMVMDETGAPIGMYIYDETTGLATGWMNFADGSTNMYPEGEEIDLGMPDESLMIDIPGTVDMAAVVYGNAGKAVSAHFYLLYSDESAKDLVISSAATALALEFTETSEGVLSCVKDEAAIAADFAMQEEFGMVFAAKDAQAYAKYLKQYYSLKIENAANPYVPYSGHVDPEGLDFDRRAVLTGPGTFAVEQEHGDHLKCMTDYIYEKDGVVVAQYIYFEFDSAAYAQAAYDANTTFNQKLITDTVLMGSLEGEEMQSVLDQYMGYNMISDKALDTYVTYLEGAFESTVYE